VFDLIVFLHLGDVMKNYRLLQKITGGILSSAGLFYGGYTYGQQRSVKKLEQPEGWQGLSAQTRHRLFGAATTQINWSELGTEQVRSLLPDILDAAKIPHGDMAVPSKTVASRRHILAQWQRTGAGA
jgi:hypothetical protein